MIDLMIDLIIDLSIDLMIDLLHDWSIDRLYDRRTDWMNLHKHAPEEYIVRKQIEQAQDEPQWIVAQRLLSTLTIPGFSLVVCKEFIISIEENWASSQSYCQQA